jgi:peptidoglycan hydrolase-like protein with peptidoglycan-binding domain
MLPGRVKLQLAAFLLLSGGVAANLLLQPLGRGAAGRAGPSSGESRLADAQGAGFGDTGSIARPPRDGDRGGRSPKAASDHAIAAVEIPEGSSEVTRAVQRELKARGYETGAADGAASSVTRAAIMGFEFDHGLPLTGRPSQELLKYILLGGARPKAGRPSTGPTAEAEDVIRSVQTSLSRLGYKPGRIDGKLAAGTARAIREFEVDQSLPESGRISGPLVARLERLAGDGRIASRR